MSCCLHDACKDKAGELGPFGKFVLLIGGLTFALVAHYCF